MTDFWFMTWMRDGDISALERISFVSECAGSDDRDGGSGGV